VQFAHETAGAARTRLSLRPLIQEGQGSTANLGRTAPRDCEGAFIELKRNLSSVVAANAGPIRRGFTVRSRYWIPSITMDAGGYGSLRSQGRR